MSLIESSVLGSLSHAQWLALGLCFIWSGFVRSGLGFGGAALALPLMLMVINEPILLLPAICWHLLIFSSLTVATRISNVDWRFLMKLSGLLAVPFAAGLFGLLNLPGAVLTIFVYAVTLGYGLLYALDRVLVSSNRWMDGFCLLTGGYVSGVSLIGAPLIVAYSARRVEAHRLRDTLFVMWIVLVLFKLTTFVAAGVDLQLVLASLMLPLVAVGHMMGMKLHEHLLHADRASFHRLIGCGLMLVSVLGLASAL